MAAATDQRTKETNLPGQRPPLDLLSTRPNDRLNSRLSDHLDRCFVRWLDELCSARMSAARRCSAALNTGSGSVDPVRPARAASDRRFDSMAGTCLDLVEDVGDAADGLAEVLNGRVEGE